MASATIRAYMPDMSPSARRGLYIFLAALVLIVGGVVYEQFWLGGGDNAGPALGGSFSLVDQNGTPRRDSDFRGKLMLVYFGYTFCPDVCPTTLQTITDAMTLLGDKADQVQPIFVSVDPRRDTPKQLNAYAANFTPRLTALTGAPEELRKVERAYRIYVGKVPESGGDDYLLDHSAAVYLMGRDGRYLTQFPSGLSAKAMAASVERYL